jgi:hypothetical protein
METFDDDGPHETSVSRTARNDWVRIENVLAVERDWQPQPQSPPQPLSSIALAQRLDALAVHFLEESAEARLLAKSCRQYAAELRAGAE